MATIFSFGVSRPGLRTFKLFGNGSVEVKQISFGLFSLTWFDEASVVAFHKFMGAGMEFDAYLAEHAPAVRLAKKRARAKMLAELRQRTDALELQYKEQNERLLRENRDLRKHVADLEAALRVLPLTTSQDSRQV